MVRHGNPCPAKSQARLVGNGFRLLQRLDVTCHLQADANPSAGSWILELVTGMCLVDMVLSWIGMWSQSCIEFGHPGRQLGRRMPILLSSGQTPFFAPFAPPPLRRARTSFRHRFAMSLRWRLLTPHFQDRHMLTSLTDPPALLETLHRRQSHPWTRRPSCSPWSSTAADEWTLAALRNWSHLSPLSHMLLV